MRNPTRALALMAACVLVSLTAPSPALAGAHLWVVNEVFSNADGTIQFVELWDCCTSGEVLITGLVVSSASTGLTSTPFLSNLPPGSTLNKHLLLGTAGFAALPCAPALDTTLPDNFLGLFGDTIQWHTYAASRLAYGLGGLPTDGVNSLQQGGAVGPNSPTNFADVTCSVDASPTSPPGVPEGIAGTAMTVGPVNGAGEFDVFWDDTTCANPGTHSILWGQGSDLPAAPGGTYLLSGSVCGIGNTSPFLWSGSPVATDGSGLIWWLMVTQSGAVEGPWGSDGAAERDGAGPGGSSAECLVTTKSLANACGQ